MKNRDSFYKRFIRACLAAVKRILPPYSSKFSKKTYTQHQLASTVCLMRYENKHYRDTVELLKASYIPDYLGLAEIPHYTTIQKFFQRISLAIWDFILSRTYRMFGVSASNIGIDATGYGERHASHYYTQKIKGKAEIKLYMKHSIAVDTDKQAVVASRDRQSKAHDNKDFIPLVRKSGQIVRLKRVVADKGYDSEANHEYVRGRLKAKSVIPLRNDKPVWRTKGRYRKKLRRYFPKKQYHQRSKVETVNSVEKRKFGDGLYSRLWYMRRREMKLIDIVYNLYRYVKLNYIFVMGFLQS